MPLLTLKAIPDWHLSKPGKNWARLSVRWVTFWNQDNFCLAKHWAGSSRFASHWTLPPPKETKQNRQCFLLQGSSHVCWWLMHKQGILSLFQVAAYIYVLGQTLLPLKGSEHAKPMWSAPQTPCEGARFSNLGSDSTAEKCVSLKEWTPCNVLGLQQCHKRSIKLQGSQKK